MGLEFQRPPDWLIQEYMKRKTPYEEASDAIGTGLNAYLSIDQSKRKNALAEQQIALERQNASREGREQFFDYGDVASLPQDIQQGVLNPAEGPVTEQGIGPQKSPLVRHYEEFRTKYPQGLKGASAMLKENKVPDEKRTYQEKQEVFDGEGTPIGYMVLDTRSGKKEFRSYADDAGGGGQIPPGASFGPKVKPAVPPAAVEKSVAGKGFIDLLDRIEKNYKPEYVGPIESRKTAFAQKYDAKAIGLGATAGASDFGRDLADLRSAIVNERTGAAVGERQEWDRLLELIPDEKKSDIDFLPKIKSIRNRYNEIIKNRESGYKKAKYRSQNSSVSGTPEQPTGMEHMSDEELQRIANGG